MGPCVCNPGLRDDFLGTLEICSQTLPNLLCIFAVSSAVFIQWVKHTPLLPSPESAVQCCPVPVQYMGFSWQASVTELIKSCRKPQAEPCNQIQGCRRRGETAIGAGLNITQGEQKCVQHGLHLPCSVTCVHGRAARGDGCAQQL